MIPVLMRIGPLTIYSYGLMMALGFIAADIVVMLECRRRQIPTDYASSLVLWAAIAGLAGARLLDIANNLGAYLADPKTMLLSGSGFVWYGGLIGGILAAAFVSRRYGVRFLTTADIAAPALAIGQALGRVGCQLSGDGDWGLPSKLPWAMAYPHAIVGWNAQTVLKLDSQGNLVSGFYPGVRVQPAPVYETILYLAVFAVLWSMRRRVQAEGRIFYLYLVLAGASRFLVEFVRVNPRVFLGLTEAQIVAAVMIVLGTAALALGGHRQTVTDSQREAVRAWH